MADSTEGDNVQVQKVVLLALALVTLIPGLVIHSFIIGVNVTDWWKGRSVTAVNHIVTSLGISRLCAQCAVTIYMFVAELTPQNLYSRVTLVIMDQLYCFFFYVSIWLTSLLSIVLCLKISNLHTRLFLYLRRTILHRTLHLIVASILLSAVICLTTSVITEVTKVGTYNTTMDEPFKDCIYNNLIYSNTVGAYIPMLFYSISSVLLFTSLYHHTTRMKMSSNLSINLETYYSVMRFVSVTFICKTFYFIADFVCAYYYFHCLTLYWLSITLGFLPVLHSSYLIYATAKLRDQMSKVLHNIMDLLLQRKDTETQENIEMAAQ